MSDDQLGRLRQLAQRRQEAAIRLSQAAERTPLDTAARSAAVEAWRVAEHSWRVVGAYEQAQRGKHPIPANA